MNFIENLNLLGIEAQQIPCIKGEGTPSSETVGAIGLLYMDIVTGRIYKCTTVTDGVYAWVDILEEVNNKIEGAEETLIQINEGGVE